jgi:hypothetical protein
MKAKAMRKIIIMSIILIIPLMLLIEGQAIAEEQIRPIELAQIQRPPITQHWSVPAHNALVLYDPPENVAGIKDMTGVGVECGFEDNNNNIVQLDKAQYTLLQEGTIRVKCFYNNTRVQGQVETLSSESLIEVN